MFWLLGAKLIDFAMSIQCNSCELKNRLRYVLVVCYTFWTLSLLHNIRSVILLCPCSYFRNEACPLCSRQKVWEAWARDHKRAAATPISKANEKSVRDLRRRASFILFSSMLTSKCVSSHNIYLKIIKHLIGLILSLKHNKFQM